MLFMSNYSKFLNDLNEFYRNRKTKGIIEKISNDDALAAVRDKWIAQGNLSELNSFIHTNWDSGNCDEFIEPLSLLLIETKQSDLFKTLWTRIIKYRLTALWISLDDLKKEVKKINLTEIVSIDTSTFNMLSRDSYKDFKRVLAFRRQFAIDGLIKMKSGLVLLNQIDEADEVSNLIKDVGDLKRSTFKL